MFDLEDKHDELYFEAVYKMSIYAGLYFTNSAVKPEDFKKFEDEWARLLAVKAEETKPETKPVTP